MESVCVALSGVDGCFPRPLSSVIPQSLFVPQHTYSASIHFGPYLSHSPNTQMCVKQNQKSTCYAFIQH